MNFSFIKILHIYHKDESKRFNKLRFKCATFAQMFCIHVSLNFLFACWNNSEANFHQNLTLISFFCTISARALFSRIFFFFAVAKRAAAIWCVLKFKQPRMIYGHAENKRYTNFNNFLSRLLKVAWKNLKFF